jgi:hypothetical protein
MISLKLFQPVHLVTHEQTVSRLDFDLPDRIPLPLRDGGSVDACEIASHLAKAAGVSEAIIARLSALDAMLAIALVIGPPQVENPRADNDAETEASSAGEEGAGDHVGEDPLGGQPDGALDSERKTPKPKKT